jgi:hypothetical protein
MKKNFLSLALVLCGVFLAQAQNTSIYTYHNDHRFWDTDDIIGYTFVVGARENPPSSAIKKLRAGEVVFKVMRDYLYITEGSAEVKYSVNQITAEKYGFKLHLMDARNPSIQGHVKVVLDEMKFVRSLIFKKSREEKEVIFHLLEPTKQIIKTDAKYFTHKDSAVLKTKETFWKKSFRPFFEVSGTQHRLYTEDSLTVSFTKDTVITKKAKIPTAKDSVLIAAGKKKAEKDKIKIIDQIHLRYLEQDEKDPSGARKVVVLDYEITDIKRLINNEDSEQAQDMRFKYELKVDKMPEPFLLFLTEKETLSVIVIGEFSYLMQGM